MVFGLICPALVLDTARSPRGAAVAAVNVVVANTAIVAAASATVMIFMSKTPFLCLQCRAEAAC